MVLLSMKVGSLIIEERGKKGVRMKGIATRFSGPYIIEAENALKKFGDLVAVNRISFQAATGECFGILGPNGAGRQLRSGWFMVSLP